MSEEGEIPSPKRARTEEEEEEEEREEEIVVEYAEPEVVPIDLTDKKYVGFIIPADGTNGVLCSIMPEEDMFPFLAIPLEKRLTFNEVKEAIHCSTGERVKPKAPLAALGVKWIIVDEEGMCKPQPVFNVDASALAARGFSNPFVGDVAFLKYAFN